MFKTAWNKKAKAEGAGTKGKPAEEAGVSLEMEVAEAEVVEDALEPEQQAVEVAEAGRLAAEVENAALRPRAKSTVHLNAFMRPRESAIMASPVDRNLVHLKRVASKGMGAGHPI